MKKQPCAQCQDTGWMPWYVIGRETLLFCPACPAGPARRLEAESVEANRRQEEARPGLVLVRQAG